MSGHWPFASGIMHSKWIATGCVVMENDGPRRGLDGVPETGIMFLPTREAEIIDTWHVAGLRGSGSHDYRLTDLFVPASHVVAPSQVSVLPSPLYRLPRHTVFGVTIAAVLLGIARAALDAAKDVCTRRTPRVGSVMLRDKPVAQAAIGRAEAQFRAARAFLFEACEDAWLAAASQATVTLDQRVAVRLALAQCGETAKTVAQTAYDLGGGASVYNNSPLQRCFNDVHAASQHAQVQSSNFETTGRVMLGLEAGTPIL